MRQSTWLWRVWWRVGYRGPFQATWLWRDIRSAWGGFVRVMLP